LEIPRHILLKIKSSNINTMIDLDYIIKKDSLFANGLPSDLRMQIKNLLKQVH
jgi:hypothetical protein